MRIPKIAIVGRPNVGKSSLFNWLIGQRISIVDSVAGVTRDRVTFLLDLDPDSDKPQYIELIDTGGIGVVDEDNLSEHIEEQITIALQTADIILFVVDSKSGPVPLDNVVAERLRKLNSLVLLVANKADCEKDEKNANEFQYLGWNVINVSVKQKRGRVNLTEIIRENLISNNLLDRNSGVEIDEPIMKLAIVGRRNVGKSTLINTMLNEERVITANIPGTTRDSIDVRFNLDNKTFIVIDTPGFLRRKGIKNDLQFYSTNRAEKSILRADVVMMLFEACSQIQTLEKQLLGFVKETMKPCILTVNKWDTMAGQMPTERWADYIRETFPDLRYAPIAFITGKTGKNIKTAFNHAQMLFNQARQRISTARLNKLINVALDSNPPPLYHFHKPRVYYVSQVAVLPPTIVMFSNMPDAFSQQYQRYLVNFLRDELPFAEVPIRLIIRKREGTIKNDITIQ